MAARALPHAFRWCIHGLQSVVSQAPRPFQRSVALRVRTFGTVTDGLPLAAAPFEQPPPPELFASMGMRLDNVTGIPEHHSGPDVLVDGSFASEVSLPFQPQIFRGEEFGSGFSSADVPQSFQARTEAAGSDERSTGVFELAEMLRMLHKCGSRRDHERLHQQMVRIEREQYDLDVSARAHGLLQAIGSSEFHAAFHDYLAGVVDLEGSRRIVFASLDVLLLVRFGTLLEDVSVQWIEKWRLDQSLLSCSASAARLRTLLYGENTRFPVPLPVSDDRKEMGNENFVTPLRRQFVIERLTQSAAVAEYEMMQRELAEEGRIADSKKRVWMPWVRAMAARITELQEQSLEGAHLQNKEDDALCQLTLTPELVGLITCQTVLNLIYLPVRKKWRKVAESGTEFRHMSAPYLALVVAVGDAVLLENSWHVEHGGQKGKRSAKVTQKTIANLITRSRKAEGEWDQKVDTVPVGAALVRMLMESATIDIELPKLSKIAREELEQEDPEIMRTEGGKANVKVFLHNIVREGKKTIGTTSIRQCAYERMDMSYEETMGFIAPKHQPMVMRPKPWRPSTRSAECSYVMHKVPFVRTTNQASTNLRYYWPQRVCGVMDSLGSVPWSINRRILKVMDEVWNQQLELAGVPPQKDPEVPGLPEDFELLGEKEQQMAKLKQYNTVKWRNELQSERPTFLLKMQVARDFQHAPSVYFPHNVDFRGRTYPVPPHLNHIGDDVCRGLLMFAEAKPLGKHGLYWLKVNLGNLIGKDKTPLDERADHVDSCRETIIKVAKDPLAPESLAFWSKAPDGPWQALARCFELAEAWESGDPEAFCSRQPVHLDGSCNGLQHYAALGRDEWGAVAVNLVQRDKPQDVYMIVLTEVKAKVMALADSEDEEAPDRDLARRVRDLGLLQRKVVKQTIMTICYGVTTIGAKQQVQGQIETLVGDHVDPAEIKLLAGFLSKLVLRSIDEVFERAMRIKRWFDEASKIFYGLNAPVSWVSPIGLSCTQPYFKKKMVKVATRMQSVTFYDEPEDRKVDSGKQRMGFPPNFVHSLDSSHMMMVAEECSRRGICFAGVHDSFWTHAADTPVLNELIREKWVEMYEKPILDDLHEDFKAQLGSHADLLPDLPKQGSLDITAVLSSPYMFD